ncbi:noggin-2-like [Hetaerina americana]|uniref:noggin-2-like n=1 Tax=Hetaerina americana TaxID=62018 RepID=UPI003A7F0F4F
MAVASFWCLVLVALEGCWGRSTHGQSPHEQGLRSSPELPLPDLIESPLKKYDPGLQDLNVTELHLILGKGFHPGFMSVSQPPAPPRGRKRNHWWKRRRRKGRPTDRPQSIRGFLDEAHPNKSSLPTENRSRLPPWIADHLTPDTTSTAARRRRGGRKRGSGGGGGTGGGRGRRRKKDDDGGGGSGRWRRKLRRLLLSITHCPVRWTWKDVGIRFWPRWVKEGKCGEPTCSIPAGMVCRPARKRRITLLRWYCREWKDLGDLLTGEGSGGKASWAAEENGGSSNLKCQWIKVEYPIVTECSCQCPE